MGTRDSEPDFSGQRNCVSGHGYDSQVLIDAGVPVGKALRVMEITLICSLLVVFFSLAWSVVHMRRVDSDLHREHIALCERENAINRRINELIAASRVVLRPIVLPDCQAIIK